MCFLGNESLNNYCFQGSWISFKSLSIPRIYASYAYNQDIQGDGRTIFFGGSDPSVKIINY